ncbi:MAG: hypothetical protein IKM95_08255 [Bacteroidales bacterium]|nr:hypothetical protein [Bacteroidales bacterium]
MRIHRLFIAITFALTPVILDAQEISIGTDQDKPIEERILYNHETTINATIHTQGLGAGFKTGRIRSIYNSTYWDFEFSYLRSLKQIPIINTSYFSMTTFIYGKLNEVFVLRGGYGGERRIYGKPYWGGVELRWLYEGGISLGLLKPYYYSVSVAKIGSNGQYSLEVEQHTFDSSSQWVEVIGKAPFKYGLDEIKLRPGIHAKTGLSFEFGSSKPRAQAIDVGAVAEYFPQGIAMMAENPTEYFILTLYLSYRWGSRFNK